MYRLKRILTSSVCSLLLLVSILAAQSNGTVGAWGLKPADEEDCTTTIFDRCIKQGYFTGAQDQDDIPLSFPLPNVYGYSDSCYPAASIITKWSFPEVTGPNPCNSTRNQAYTEAFIKLIKAHLDNYANPDDPYTAITNYDQPTGHARRNGLAAAMYIDTMMGVQGNATWGKIEWNGACAFGDWWSKCYKGSMDNGVIKAHSLFDQWAERVRLYDQKGLINWNGEESYTAGSPNSGGMNAGTDIGWHKMTTAGAKSNIIIFYSPVDGRRLFGINRDCGNLVGNLEPLDDINKGFELTPSSQKPSLSPDEEAPTSATFAGNKITVATDLGISSVKRVTVTKRYYVEKLGGDLTSDADDIVLNSATMVSVVDIPIAGLTLATDAGVTLPSGLSAGDQVCVTISVNPKSGKVNSGGIFSEPSAAYTSAPACTRISNKPYVVFSGNDVKAGGGVEGSADCASHIAGIGLFKNASNQGSSVQLAAFALGAINGVNTAAYASTAAGANPTVNGLTFANFNNYGSTCTHNFFADKDDDAPTWTGTIGAAEKYKATGPVTLGTMNIANGQHAFLYVTGNVNITGNITADQGPWTDRSQIPSFYVIATGNITISNNVKEIAGVFVAQTGAIYTCSEGGVPVVPDQLFSNCGNQLVVNGAFIAKTVVFGRAYGSLRNSASEQPYGPSTKICATSEVAHGLTSTCASEVFRYNPSLYLGAAPKSKKTEVTTEDSYESITNLPPVL